VPDVASPIVIDVPNNLVIGPPSAVVPSCVCPVLLAKAASNWLNSSLVCAAVITSPSVYDDCLVYVCPIYLLAPVWYSN
jgi:hypothetical protein